MRAMSWTTGGLGLLLVLAACAGPEQQVSLARETTTAAMAREELPTMNDVRSSMREQGGSLIVGRIARSIEGPGSASPEGVPIRAGEPGYEPATDSEVTDVRVLAGHRIEGAVTLHQLLAPGQEYDSIPKLDVGKTYVMAIRPSTFGDPSLRTGQYILVGLEAAWVQQGSGDFAWVGKPEKSSARYPGRVTIDGITSALQP